MSAPPRVFVSHTTQDKRDLALAQALATGVKARGGEAFIAPDRIPPGAVWKREIIEAIVDRSTHFIVIVSAASIASDWVQKEIELARIRHEVNEAFQILPLPVGQVGYFPGKDFLSQFQNLRYFDNLDIQLQEVARGLGLPAVPWVDYLKNVVRESGTISILPGQRNVPVDAISPIRLTRLRENGKRGRSLELHNLAELPELESQVILVGPGGCGKSTALQWLAHRMATQLLASTVDQSDDKLRAVGPAPLLFNLTSYTTNLLELAKQVLMNRGAVLDDELLRAQLSQGSILLLLDSFDEVTNKRKLASELQEILVFSPGARMIISSRLVSSLENPLFGGFARFDVEALDNAQMQKIFSLQLGDAKAELLFHLIEDQELIEAFRQPLMACLVSMTFEQNDDQHLPISKGALYNKILTYFIRQWEAKRNDQLVISDVSLKVECLNRLGYEMTVANRLFLSQEEVEEIWRGEIRRTEGFELERLGRLIEDLFATGLLKKVPEGVTFFHLSFKHFFAASWLKANFSLTTTVRFSWQPQWHDALVQLTGLMSPSQAFEFLRWMIFFSRISIPVARIGPYSWTANHILLTLNCLGNTNESNDGLKNQLVSQLEGREVFLSNATITPDQTLPSVINGIYAYFCVLVGKLRTPTALGFLRRYKIRQFRVCGLAQFRDMGILLQEFEDPDKSDGGVADDIAADFILRYPAESVVRVIEEFLGGHEIDQRKRLLRSLNHCLAQGDERTGHRYSDLSQNNQWIPLMTEIALRDKNREVRDYALAIIRSFGEHKFRLPSTAEQMITAAAREDPDEKIRMRALWYLAYARSDAALDLLREVVNEATEWLTLTALDALRYRDRDNFPAHMATAIRRMYPELLKREEGAIFEESLASLGLTDSVLSDLEQKEMMVWLIAGAVLHEMPLIRKFSIEALFISKQKQVLSVLNFAFLRDDDEGVREEALLGLEVLLGTDVEPYLYQAFEDPSAVVRKAAVTSFYRLPEELGVKAIPRLQEIGKIDSDRAVRVTALSVAERFIRDTQTKRTVTENP